MNELTSFGAWLKRRRKALDLTQDDLAQRVGVAIGTVRKWEADERRPSRDVVERLVDVLQVAPDDRASFSKLARAEVSLDRLELTAADVMPEPSRSMPDRKSVV